MLDRNFVLVQYDEFSAFVPRQPASQRCFVTGLTVKPVPLTIIAALLFNSLQNYALFIEQHDLTEW
jgi:hypothetical protein